MYEEVSGVGVSGFVSRHVEYNLIAVYIYICDDDRIYIWMWPESLSRYVSASDTP